MSAIQAQHVVHESTVNSSQRPDHLLAVDRHPADDVDCRQPIAFRVASASPCVVFLSNATSFHQHSAESIQPVGVVRWETAKLNDRSRRHTEVTLSE